MPARATRNVAIMNAFGQTPENEPLLEPEVGGAGASSHGRMNRFNWLASLMREGEKAAPPADQGTGDDAASYTAMLLDKVKDKKRCVKRAIRRCHGCATVWVHKTAMSAHECGRRRAQRMHSA